MPRRRNVLSPEQIVAPGTEYVPPRDYDAAVDAFIRDCRIRNLSEYTIRFYRNELSGLRKLLEADGRDSNPVSVTAKDIKERVILRMMNEGRKESAINARLRACRAFFNFLERERMIPVNPMDSVTLVKQKRRVIETFTREQIQALLRQPNQKTFTGIRDYTMLLLLFETGVRVKELVNIRVDDVRLEDGMIRIRDPKGSRERLVPFQSKMKRQLMRYLSIRGKSDCDHLFITLDDTPVAVRSFQERMAEYGKKAGIENVRCSPHTARHTFAKMYIQNGGDAFSLQKILGHTSLEMTRVYVELFSNDVARAHSKVSPVERLL